MIITYVVISFVGLGVVRRSCVTCGVARLVICRLSCVTRLDVRLASSVYRGFGVIRFRGGVVRRRSGVVSSLSGVVRLCCCVIRRRGGVVRFSRGVIGCRSGVVSCRSSVISCWSSVVGFSCGVIGYRWSVICFSCCVIVHLLLRLHVPVGAAHRSYSPQGGQVNLDLKISNINKN